MAVAVSMFRWLDLLEKEFDKAFVDLDIRLGDIDADQAEITHDGRLKMTSLSSAFAQLVHKSQTIFQSNAKLEAELISLRSEATESKAKANVLERELKSSLLQLHAVQLQLHATHNNDLDSTEIQAKLENEMRQFRNDSSREAELETEAVQLRIENTDLRKYCLQLHGEVYGARLAAKYLDKELAGRIQQIQLLGRDMRGSEHDALWNQIEAEIHLHRHKTVIRACRGRNNSQEKPHAPPPSKIKDSDDLPTIARKKRGVGDVRIIPVLRDKSEGLGISITGGREHGVPILISEIHEGMPAQRCQEMYVGDAILSVNGKDLQSATHAEAVHVLSRVYGRVELELLYLDVNGSSDEENWEDDVTQRYSSVGFVDNPNNLTGDDVITTNSLRDTGTRQIKKAAPSKSEEIKDEKDGYPYAVNHYKKTSQNETTKLASPRVPSPEYAVPYADTPKKISTTSPRVPSPIYAIPFADTTKDKSDDIEMKNRQQNGKSSTNSSITSTRTNTPDQNGYFTGNSDKYPGTPQRVSDTEAIPY